MVEITEKLRIHNVDEWSNLLQKAPVGIITFDETYKINFVNENLINLGLLYNFKYEDLTGKSILDVEVFPGLALKEELLEIQSGYSFEKEFSRTDTGIASVSVIIKCSPISEEHEFHGGILVVEDLRIIPKILEEGILKTEHFEKIINKANDLLFITDSEGKVKFYYGKQIRQLNNDIALGFQINKIFSPEARGEFDKYLDLVNAKRRSEKFNLELLVGENKLIYECRMEPLLNRKGQIQFIFFFLNEITELLQHNETLAKQVNELKQYQYIAETISDSIIVVDTGGKIILWNKASETLFGHSKADVSGKFLGKALGLFDEEYFNNIIDEVNKNKSWKINLTFNRGDGKKEIVESRFSQLPSGTMLVVHFTNITEKFTIEQQLKTSEERFKNILSLTDDIILTLEPDGVITYTNEKFTTVLGFSNEIAGKNFRELIDPHYLGKNTFDLKEFKNNPDKKIELPLISKFGTFHFCTARFAPVLSANKTIKSINAFLSEINTAKKVEKDLFLFKTLFETSHDGIAIMADGKIVLLNESFAKIFGYKKKEEIISYNILEFVSSDDSLRVAEYLQLIEQRKEAPGRIEFLARRKDRSVFYVEISPSVFNIESKTYTVINTRDFTERKRAQQAIRESEEKYRNITENIDDFLFTFERIDHILRPLFYTSSVEKITGYTQSEFLSDSTLFLKIIYPDDFQSVKKKLKSVMRSRLQISEEMEFRIINKHGNIVWVRTKINIIRTTAGKVSKIYGLVSDISLRKKAEEELTRSTENLVKLNDTKDKFISIISHDLRTPFSSILGFTDLLLVDDELTEDEKKQYVKFIQESSKSMLALVNSLLDWTRLQTGRIKFEPEKILAESIIRNSINSLSGTAFQKNISIISRVDENITIYADDSLMMQVFNNLISNAIKFTKPGGEIVITAMPSVKTRFYEFSVKDNGVGIKPENLPSLFRIDAKYSSEGTAGERGTGLGLSLVNEIIEKHGGIIWVESDYGFGSEFKFTLPIASANILLVDDSKTDRLLYSKIVKNITPDYKIEIASNGKEALEKIKNIPPALVITDHFMPEMNGYELVLELKKLDIKGKPQVIILSGDIDRSAIEDYNNIGVEFVFHKPVNLSEFKNAVEKSLRKGLTG
jgi:PAS domain S-box-containing protein